jgi:hypothetical protein
MLTPDRLSELPLELKNLCATYPGLDGYNIAVVSDPTLPESLAFRDFLHTYVIRPQREWQQYKRTFVAGYWGGELTLFPVDPERTSAVKMGKSWCVQ